MLRQEGKSYGVPDLSKLFFGSGGGGGGTYWKDEATGSVTGLPGSDGGGIVYILADTINFSGQINARGQDGVTGYAGIAADGGSGAGGSVRIEGRNVTLNTVNVLGGMVTAPGSVGRVAVHYANSFSANFTPGHLLNTNSTFVDSITSEGFENDLSIWTISAPGSSTVSTSLDSAYWADKGLQVDILDNSDTYAQNNNQAAEKSYNARVYINSDLLKIAANDVFTILSGQTGTGDLFQVQMQQTTIRQVRLLVYKDDDSSLTTSWFTILPGWHALEVQIRAASLPYANDGSASLLLDGSLLQSLTNLDNDTKAVSAARLGVAGIDTGTPGTLGTIYYDDFESRRFSDHRRAAGSWFAQPEPGSEYVYQSAGWNKRNRRIHNG